MHFVLKKQEILGRIALLCNFFKSTVEPGQYGRFTVQLGQESIMRKQLLQGRTHFGRAYQQ